jgi:hypothetical protein
MIAPVGICLEFGPQITEACDEAMIAADQRCVCPGCGAVCRGRFPGCPEVWNRGPSTVSLISKSAIGRSTGQAGLRSGLPGGEQPGDPDRLPGNNGPVVSRPVEQSAAVVGSAEAVEETLLAVDRQPQRGHELPLHARLDQIECRLDQLTAAMRADGSFQDRSADGDGSGRVDGAKPGPARSAS